MSKVEFNHDADSIFEASGITEEGFETKFNETINKFNTQEKKSLSVLVEMLEDDLDAREVSLLAVRSLDRAMRAEAQLAQIGALLSQQG